MAKGSIRDLRERLARYRQIKLTQREKIGSCSSNSCPKAEYARGKNAIALLSEVMGMRKRNNLSPEVLDASLLPKQRKPIPHAFVLDALSPLSPHTRPMFGCLAIYVQDKNCVDPAGQA